MISRLHDDERGIALQTIIILVVLLAIAGAVAAVILTRAGTETDRLEEETDRWTGITNETGCEIAGGAWSNPGNPGSCGTPGTAIHIRSNTHAANATECHTTNSGGDNHAHAFAASEDANNNGILDAGEDTNGNSALDLASCT